MNQALLVVHFLSVKCFVLEYLPENQYFLQHHQLLHHPQAQYFLLLHVFQQHKLMVLEKMKIAGQRSAGQKFLV